MKRYLISVFMVLFISTALTNKISFGEELKVTILNLTKDQPFSPPLVVSHNDEFELFTPGTKASAGLESMAEGGDTSGLLAEIEDNENVDQVITAMGPVAPGGSITISIDIDKDFKYISSVGMLVNTNDSFYGLNGAKISKKKSRKFMTVIAPAYESGTEENNEDCAFIPGPFCTDSTPGGAEEDGVIVISNGVHGIGDLMPELHDWRNPVAKITIKKD